MGKQIESTVDAIKELLSIFQMERVVYLIITVISVIILLFIAVWLIFNSETDKTLVPILGLFGSSGGITYSIGRLLKMWSKAMELLQTAIEKENGGK